MVVTAHERTTKGTDVQTIITLPIRERVRAHRFYTEALGLEPVGEPGEDGLPEPLQFRLGDGVNLMLIPREGFGWVLGEQPAADAGRSECLLQWSCDEDDEVDAVIERAAKAGATVVLPPQAKPWGHTGSFTDPDGHLWVVTNAEPW